MTHASDPQPRRPKSSIFDLTLPGTAPHPSPKGFFGRWSHAEEEAPTEPPAPEPRMYRAPHTAVAEPDAPTLPASVLERTLQAALIDLEPDADDDRFEITDPGIAFAASASTQLIPQQAPIREESAHPSASNPRPLDTQRIQIIQPALGAPAIWTPETEDTRPGTEVPLPLATQAFPLQGITAIEPMPQDADPFEGSTAEADPMEATLLLSPAQIPTVPEEAYEVTDPCTPLPSPASAAQPQEAPAAMSTVTLEVGTGHATPVVDEDPFDDCTAAEWNPKWNSIPGVLSPLPRPAVPAPIPAPEPVSVQPFPMKRLLPWAGGTAAILATAVWLLLPTAPTPVAPAPLPETLRPYLSKAEAGDVASMRLLGLRLAYGVDAPMNREAGVRWLTRAAQAGSPAAAQELRALGVAVTPKIATRAGTR